MIDKHELLSRIENDIYENGVAIVTLPEMKQAFTVIENKLYDPSDLWSAHYADFDEQKQIYCIYPKRPTF